MHHYNASILIRFNIYNLITRCKVHGRRSLYKRNFVCLCFQDTATVTPDELHTSKELVIIETFIDYFHTSFYITETENL